MKLERMEHVDSYEEAFTPHMRIDVREKIQNSNIFIIVFSKGKFNEANCKKAIVMKDLKGLCKTKESFRRIDFEVIKNNDIDNYSPEYYIGKNICNVIE